MPTPCNSGYSIDWSASLEPSLPFASLLAPVRAADGPGSSHPPASPNGMILPLVRMIPFLSHGSIQPLFLAHAWTDFGDPALEGWPSPQLSPSSSRLPPSPVQQQKLPPSPSFLTSLVPWGLGVEHSLLQWAQQVPGFRVMWTLHPARRCWLDGLGHRLGCRPGALWGIGMGLGPLLKGRGKALEKRNSCCSLILLPCLAHGRGEGEGP